MGNDPLLMAEHFNVFFSNVANDIVSKIHPVTTPLLNTEHIVDSPLNFANDPVTTGDILEATDLIKEKSTQDFNGVSIIFLKIAICFKFIDYLGTRILYRCFTQCDFP